MFWVLKAFLTITFFPKFFKIFLRPDLIQLVKSFRLIYHLAHISHFCLKSYSGSKFWPGFFTKFKKKASFFVDTLVNCFKVVLCVENYVLFSKNTFSDIQFQKLQNISKKPKIFEFFENSPLYLHLQTFIAILYIKKFLIFYSIF